MIRGCFLFIYYENPRFEAVKNALKFIMKMHVKSLYKPLKIHLKIPGSKNSI